EFPGAGGFRSLAHLGDGRECRALVHAREGLRIRRLALSVRGRHLVRGGASRDRACEIGADRGADSASGRSVPGPVLWPDREKLALKVVPPMMSVPMRSQSGASPGSSRIQLCRSVTPAGKAVPGGTSAVNLDSATSILCSVQKWTTRSFPLST